MSNIEKIKSLVKDIQNLFLTKRYNLIIKESQKAIRQYPSLSIFYNLKGLALTQIGKFHEAKIILERGYKTNPDDLAIINNLANVNKNMFNFNEAKKLYNLSISKKKDYFNSYVNYGNLNKDLNKFEEAIELYKKALNYTHEIPEIYYSLAMAYQSIGNFKEAENYANKTIEIDKKITKADLLISRSKKYTSDDIHLNKMNEKLKNTDLNNSQKIDLYFALAKAYEDLADMDTCFKYLKQGNELKRSNINFDLGLEKRKFENIKKIFSKIDHNKFKCKELNTKKIIFILGMPRSGTTLTEQIISGHSEVYGCGELPYLSKIINDEFNNTNILSESKVNETFNNNEKISKISNKYYSFLENYKISSEYVTDKAPLNFVWIGFIKIFFPNAKIIHCKRNMKDNCVSLYKNVFDGNLNFCYTQKELANYYNLYCELMEFWKNQFTDSFLDIEYEKLITDTVSESKKIFKYCNLNWQENCLNISDNKTPIKTASVGQARNKIYSTSIKSYSKYDVYLDELFYLLQKKSPS